MRTFLQQCEDAVSNPDKLRGLRGDCLVNAGALRELIAHFKRVDSQVREQVACTSYYEGVLAGHRALVRELDVLLNGDGAAKQASLCDVVAQVAQIVRETGAPLLPRSTTVPDEVRHILERIHRWHGEFPTPPPFNGEPQSYGAAFGSNGERDYMRKLAAHALELLADVGG